MILVKGSLMVLILLLHVCNVFAQPSGSEEFNKIHQLINPSVIDGSVWNSSQSNDSRFQYTFTCDLNGSELNRLIYRVLLNAKEFSNTSSALGGKELIWEERKAMYIDGKETDMSGISFLLLIGKGKFSVNHEELSGMSPYSKEKLEIILSRIMLENLEK